MKLIPALALAFLATAANAAPFPSSTAAQTSTRTAPRYHLFIVYYSATGVTSPIQLGPFRTEAACSRAAALLATKITIGASACLSDQ